MYTVDYVDYWYFGPCGLCGLWMHRGLCGVAPQNALAFIPCYFCRSFWPSEVFERPKVLGYNLQGMFIVHSTGR